MKYIVFLLLISNSLFSQDSRLKVISEQKISDSLVLQVAELMIFNNMGHPICIKVSTTFDYRILSRDTIELGPLNKGTNCWNYDLWVSKEDLVRGFYDNPRYPIVLNNRTCFAANVSYIKNIFCKDQWIEYSFVSQENINYNELLDLYEHHQIWDSGGKFKYRTERIYLR